VSTLATPDGTLTARRPPRDVRRLRRIATAVLLPVPLLCIAVSPFLAPEYGRADTSAALAAIRADPGLKTAGLWVGLVASLAVVPAFVGAARLARRRRPLVAALAAGVNALAYLGAAVGLGSTGVGYLVAARPEFASVQLAPYLDALMNEPVAGVPLALFVFGHLVGGLLLAWALWRIVPTWAALAVGAAPFLHLVAFVGLQNRTLDALTYALGAAGFMAISVTILQTADDDWDVAPATA
jgi:hypothetical protein